eukprot:2371031-Prymnesium_polylepis.1
MLTERGWRGRASGGGSCASGAGAAGHRRSSTMTGARGWRRMGADRGGLGTTAEAWLLGMGDEGHLRRAFRAAGPSGGQRTGQRPPRGRPAFGPARVATPRRVSG